MMARSFEANQSFFDSILRSPKVKALVDDAAQRTLNNAIAGAPEVSGAYKDGLHIEHVQAEYREVARVVGDARHTMKVESRTGNLARAVKAARR